MKQSEFVRWLVKQGVTISKHQNGHRKAYYQGRQTTVPCHPSHEIGEGLRQAIIKQLGLK